MLEFLSIVSVGYMCVGLLYSYIIDKVVVRIGRIDIIVLTLTPLSLYVSFCFYVYMTYHIHDLFRLLLLATIILPLIFILSASTEQMIEESSPFYVEREF